MLISDLEKVVNHRHSPLDEKSGALKPIFPSEGFLRPLWRRSAPEQGFLRPSPCSLALTGKSAPLFDFCLVHEYVFGVCVSVVFKAKLSKPRIPQEAVGGILP